MTTVLETVNPTVAGTYFDRNDPNNRSIRRGRVDHFKKIITDGDWKVTHQGIAFNCDGTLKDGQHRLLAIIESGKTVQILVTRGLPNDSMTAIDNGSNRRDSDAYQIMGYDYDKEMVAIARRMWEGFTIRFTDRITREELLRFMKRHEEAIRFARAGSKRRGISNASVLAVVGRAFYTSSRQRLSEFLECLITGINNGQRDIAAITLRNIVLGDVKKFTSGAGRQSLYRKTETALAAFLKGRPLTQIKEVESERFPIPGDEA